ncbi:unnamed protein product [Onchocerca flexuosa]|uniref:Uncharacterized protein n=1 Tax=Onchocerca flexuosa TaxID=387005 RepID=A0A183HWB3_9BILA|nr:unnamed protein product [Onchocerca flexuosa]
MEKDINEKETSVKPEFATAENIDKPSSTATDNTMVSSDNFITETNEAHAVLPESAKQQIASSAVSNNETLETANSATLNSGWFQLIKFIVYFHYKLESYIVVLNYHKSAPFCPKYEFLTTNNFQLV